ncbi:MAG: hypothetical protein IJM33_07080, partial [Bacteroidales bacterium]|nr:hypothetical protein [Bacteroidales bacterium]
SGPSPKGWNRYSLRQRPRNQSPCRQMQPTGLQHYAVPKFAASSPAGCWSLPSLSPYGGAIRYICLCLSGTLRHQTTELD